MRYNVSNRFMLLLMLLLKKTVLFNCSLLIDHQLIVCWWVSDSEGADMTIIT